MIRVQEELIFLKRYNENIPITPTVASNQSLMRFAIQKMVQFYDLTPIQEPTHLETQIILLMHKHYKKVML